jgi:hypothetical protein
MTGFGIRRPDLIDDDAPPRPSRVPRKIRWTLAGVAAVLVGAGTYLGAAQDPVGTESSRQDASAWIAAHPAGADAPTSVTESSGRLLVVALDNAHHRVLIASCAASPCVPGEAPGRTSTAATLDGNGAGLELTVPADGGFPHISWTDAAGPHLLICSQSDCLPGSFL